MLSEKIKSIMESKNLTVYKLAKLSGMSQTGLNYFLSGSKSPTVLTLQKICDALSIDMSSLFTNSKCDSEEIKLLNYYRKANDQARDSALLVLERGFIRIAKKRAKRLVVKKKDDLPFLISIPVVGRAAAGLPIEMIEEHDGSLSIDDTHVMYGDFAVVADGDSMIDAGIQDGDRVIIRPQPKVENGELALVAIGGGSTIKHFFITNEGFKLVPANSQYETQYYSKDTDVRILGKVIKVINK